MSPVIPRQEMLSCDLSHLLFRRVWLVPVRPYSSSSPRPADNFPSPALPPHSNSPDPHPSEVPPNPSAPHRPAYKNASDQPQSAQRYLPEEPCTIHQQSRRHDDCSQNMQTSFSSP